MSKKRIGLMPCEGQRCESHEHNSPVVVLENERGTLSYSCQFCGRSPYARPGTGQHAEWMEEIAKRAPKAAPPAAKPVPPAASKAGQKAAEKSAGSGTFFG